MSINQYQLKPTWDSSTKYVNVKPGIECHTITGTFSEWLVIMIILQLLAASDFTQLCYHLRGQAAHYTLYCYVCRHPATVSSHTNAIIYSWGYLSLVNTYTFIFKKCSPKILIKTLQKYIKIMCTYEGNMANHSSSTVFPAASTAHTATANTSQCPHHRNCTYITKTHRQQPPLSSCYMHTCHMQWGPVCGVRLSSLLIECVVSMWSCSFVLWDNMSN